MQPLEFLSLVFGWIYTLCWSLSFYSQPLLNWRRRSTSGTTVDFPFINTFGFTAYLVSTSCFLFSPVVRSQYGLRHGGAPPAVQLNDFAFALHATILSAASASQYFLPTAWGFSDPAPQRPSRLMLGVAAGGVLAVAATWALAALTGAEGDDGWRELDIVYAVSYVKLLVTLIKYSPQVVLNYRTRSTRGWSIAQILLDFAGGILSVGQLVLDSWLIGDWSGVMGNPVKLALGNVSVAYDCVFMVQHYVLYRKGGGEEEEEEGSGSGERDPLLERGAARGER